MALYNALLGGGGQPGPSPTPVGSIKILSVEQDDTVYSGMDTSIDAHKQTINLTLLGLGEETDTSKFVAVIRNGYFESNKTWTTSTTSSGYSATRNYAEAEFKINSGILTVTPPGIYGGTVAGASGTYPQSVFAYPAYDVYYLGEVKNVEPNIDYTHSWRSVSTGGADNLEIGGYYLMITTNTISTDYDLSITNSRTISQEVDTIGGDCRTIFRLIQVSSSSITWSTSIPISIVSLIKIN